VEVLGVVFACALIVCMYTHHVIKSRKAHGLVKAMGPIADNVVPLRLAREPRTALTRIHMYSFLHVHALPIHVSSLLFFSLLFSSLLFDYLIFSPLLLSSLLSSSLGIPPTPA
jgi:hypothetical protein